MLASTDLVVLLVLSLLTVIAAIRHRRPPKATPSHARTVSTKKIGSGKYGNGDNDPNKDRRFGGERKLISEPSIRTNALLLQSGLRCPSLTHQ